MSRIANIWNTSHREPAARPRIINRSWAFAVCLCALLISARFSPCLAQDVSVSVAPVQQVLPPQAGLYIDNPGKFFTLRLINNTDNQQLVHIGMHIDQLYPSEQLMVMTPEGQLPRQPIVLAPRQSKLLNPVEMKQLFNHFNLNDIYIRDGLYNDYRQGIFGLMPEGQYRLSLQAYLWNPELTSPVMLSLPDDGQCLFNICYSAQPPRFLTPLPSFGGAGGGLPGDPLAMFNVAKLDKNVLHTFTWTQPTLNCNTTLLTFTYDVRIVRLDGLSPDEAIEYNPVVYSRSRLATTSFTIPDAYLTQMKQDSTAVYAMQVTASAGQSVQNPLNYTMIENDGKSDILLFRFHDPSFVPSPSQELPDSSSIKGSTTGERTDSAEHDSLYVFEQPMLTKPDFVKNLSRKVFVGDSIFAEWRKAWFSAGRGTRQDTIKFEYTLQLFRGNSADKPEAIFKSSPVFQHTTTELKDTIPWDKIKEKVHVNDYLILRVKAAATNEKSIRMLGDSLNYKDFALVEHVTDDFYCGTNTANVANKTLISTAPKPGTELRINSWSLEVDDVKLDANDKTLSGTGFILWGPGNMKLRIAVKFDALKVNTDGVVFDGVCNSYPKEKGKDFTAQQAVDSLFSSFGLEDIYSDLGLPQDVAEKVKNKGADVAEKYNMGQYYTYFKNAEKQWDKVKEGNLYDLYLPTEVPEEIAKHLPEDFSAQIASMMFTPKAAVMNIVAEFVLPKSDVLSNDVLIFGAPRLCIQPDRILPEDGVLCLLSNFGIVDPTSGYSMTFKAPSDPLNPTDGCFLKWENNEFGGLGVQIAMTIPNLKRVVDGKATDELPIIDIKGVVEDNWGDWMATATMDPFEVEDLPGWTFSPGGTMIFDHSMQSNDPLMPDISKLPETYDPSKCGSQVKIDWNAWQGVYISEISVQFPKWAVFGNGDEGLKIAAEKMLFDPSGATLDIAAYNFLEAKTGSAGGWEFDLDRVKVGITQNNFDDCHIEGRFAIPLFGNKTGKDGDEKQKVGFECDIRHLSEGTTVYYTYDKDGKRQEHTKNTYGEKTRLAYLFKVQQIDSLNMDCFIADVDLTKTKEQTYLVVAAEEQPDGETVTHVELCMAGDITIAGIKKLEQLGKKAGLDVTLPGIHFAKMRLANFSREHQNDKDNMVFRYANDLTADRQSKEKEWEDEHAKRLIIFENEEMELSEKCFLDLGEWSLASEAKKIGPFSFNLKRFSFDYKDEKLTLGIEGMMGLCDDKISVAAGLDISSKLTIPKDYSNISGYSLSDGDVSFRSLELDLDFSILHMNGRLDITDADAEDRGFKGAMKVDIKELFAVNCSGGYFQHKGEKEDDKFAWGYFTLDISGKAGIRIDPIVINRIAGGFYFNARPTCASAPGTPAAERKYGDPVGAKGVIGISLGVGLTTSAGEETLQGDMDLNVVYDKSVNNGDGGFSTIQFQGKVKAVGDIIDANMCLTYENNKTERYLALDLTVEGGLNGGKLQEAMTELEQTLQTFKGDLDAEVKDFMPTAEGGLEAIGSNYETTADEKDDTKEVNASAAATVESKEKEMKAMSFSIPFNMKVTWREKGVELTPVRWHLYLGEPDEKKRVQITLIDYKSKSGMISVNIGANAYLCIGNELPGNGQLPPINPTISKFLNGGANGGVDTGADAGKAQRGRNKAVKALLPTGDNVKGGVMVGASAWGYIDVNLGLFKANMTAIAGFDMALINYGNMAYCTNLNREMGYNGWYATGQFYAYLAARFDLHIELGKLYTGDVNLINAGIGGVFEAGLPNPSWVAGQARVKLSLLGGLIDIDKKFQFDCGDRCVPFKGNALDGFSLFDDFTLGSDSTAYGWSQACEVKTNEIGRAMVTTNTSLGTQHRLVDPTTAADQADRTGIDEELLDLQSSRSYIFDIDRTTNTRNGHTYGVNGVRLFEIDPSKYDGMSNFSAYMNQIRERFNGLGTSLETSLEMKSADLSSARSYGEDYNDPFNVNYRNMDSFLKSYMNKWEVDIRPRETKGSKYHLQNVSLKPNCYYVLMLTGTAYEVENGQKVWCTYVKKRKNGKMEGTRIKWQQTKFYFFSTAKSAPVPAVIEDLQPYVAAAFPASADGKLFNTETDQEQVYEGDLMRPTIALNEDIRNTSFRNGKLNWVLNSFTQGSETSFRTQTIANEYKAYGSTYVNMQPERDFTIPTMAPNGKRADHQNLQLTYTYKVPAPCYRGTNADKWEVMESYIKNEDDWSAFKEEMETFGFDPTDVSTSQQLALAVGYGDMWLNYYGAERKAAWNKYFTAYKQQNADCQKDTTIVLADLWFRQPELKTWQVATADYANAHYGKMMRYSDQVAIPVLPYSKPFVGVRPQNAPVFTYNNKYQTSKNFDIAEGWYQLAGAQNYRLKDPFLYFAYLSQMVFVGGASLRAYGFDNVAVPHASETLTLTYNGESVQGMGIAQTERLKTLRDRMFSTWNTWYYTNGIQEPEYPLPSGTGDLYDRTRANQDGKAGAYMSYYKKTNSAYPYHLGTADFIKDFAAPYYIAQALSQKMHDIAQELYSYYKNYSQLVYPAVISAWNNLHRGQYLTVSSRGFEVRVPYYQFPLIFGDCFGRGPNNESTPMDPVRNNASVGDMASSFYYSVDAQSRQKMSYRWHSYTSNLMFNRLKGGYPFATNAANQYTTYGKDKYVEWDRFQASEAMKQVTDIPLKIYRTQSFDLRKGLFAAWNETGAPASTTTYIKQNSGTREFNPFVDRASGLYKKTLYEWIQLVGSPAVTVNDTRMKTE